MMTEDISKEIEYHLRELKNRFIDFEIRYENDMKLLQREIQTIRSDTAKSWYVNELGAFRPGPKTTTGD